MGTSQSSTGSPSGVPMVPPWVPSVAEIPALPGESEESNGPESEEPTTVGEPIAPPGRFRGARLNASKFASTGSRASLGRSLGQYVRQGYGGSGNAVRRLGNTISTAKSLYTVLSDIADGQPLPGIDAPLLRHASGEQLLDGIVEAVRPIDGTQDAEANRAAIRDSLSEVLNRFPDAELQNLTEEQRVFATEQFVGFDVFRRFFLDVGKAFQDNAPDAATALSRLKEARDYIRESVAASFRKLVALGHGVTSTSVSSVVKAALRNALTVFEDYLK